MKVSAVLAFVVFFSSQFSFGAAKDCGLRRKFPTAPARGAAIVVDPVTQQLNVPARPIIPIIQGDGIGPEVSQAMMKVLDAAVKKAYGTAKKIHWYSVPAGLEGIEKHGVPLPEGTIEAIRKYVVAIKGPLGTPVGEGFRSVNVTLRKCFDLYACVRPVRYYSGVPSPMKKPEDVNWVIFRENIEDLYAGIEFVAGAEDTQIFQKLVNTLLSQREGDVQSLPNRDFAWSLKMISEFGTKRLMRRAIEHALKNDFPSVTIVHKANIMKATDGGFRRWAYEVATEEFRDQVITESELAALNWQMPKGKLLINDRIADNMFQQALLKPKSYGVIVTQNFVGDLFSDSAAAMVGGLGIAPGGNIGDQGAIFEATHGTAPDIAGQNKANPLSIILSGMMMLDYMGWTEARQVVEQAIQQALADGIVTGDLRDVPNARIVGTSEFASVLIEKIAHGVARQK